ncbi:putative orphan protein [Pseudoalteromonas luteoviolacea B = ATCC 29581]|nr:putative orphan protein [Pseudoalteromonas luteoviolacea B = ATCC 29581]
MRFLACLLLLMSASFMAGAHQLKAAVSTVLFNQNSGNIELMHRYFLHDTEHAISQIAGKKADILDNRDDQAKFANYVFERISLKVNGKPLTLVPVGFEVDGKYIWVYQETPIISDVQQITMRNNALRDMWPQQANLVNIEGLGTIRSLHFDGEDDWLSVTISSTEG